MHPLLAALLASSCGALIVPMHPRVGSATGAPSFRLLPSPLLSDTIDVSDLGLTMDDLEKPLPDLAGGSSIATSGWESTSRLPGSDDSGCRWEETAERIAARLLIPGLRGQPAAAMVVEVTSATATITAFGRVVWSCVLRGACVPDTLTFSAEDGTGMLPEISISIGKAEPGKRWGGLIASIGEDSIL
mmetsp:Transcript_7945/g.24847  ORF Transcript_7945/g.24847 Transcript_7945/m.24847 type:complete len:188 (-) Transcript_7945:32-595(-)